MSLSVPAEIHNSTKPHALQTTMTSIDYILPKGVDADPAGPRISIQKMVLFSWAVHPHQAKQVALEIHATATTTPAPAVHALGIIEPNCPLVDMPFHSKANHASYQGDVRYSWSVEPFVMAISDRTVQETLNTIRQVDHILNTIVLSYSRSEAAVHDDQPGASKSDYCTNLSLQQ
jgi:hypothetical protein